MDMVREDKQVVGVIGQDAGQNEMKTQIQMNVASPDRRRRRWWF